MSNAAHLSYRCEDVSNMAQQAIDASLDILSTFSAVGTFRTLGTFSTLGILSKLGTFSNVEFEPL